MPGTPKTREEKPKPYPTALRNPPGRGVENDSSVTDRPMYRYMCFVNALKRQERQEKLRAERKAAAKREEDRQEKLRVARKAAGQREKDRQERIRADREADKAAFEASKKDLSSLDASNAALSEALSLSEDQPKND